jgi:hypothetical protein
MQTTAAGANERVNLGGLEAIIDFEDLIRNRLEPEFNRDEGQRGLLERKITLYPRNPMFGGRHNDRDTAFLKVMTQQQYPRIAQNLQNYRLQSVKVTGKSQSRRFSTSTISFEIDGQYEDQAVIGQGRHHRPDRASMYSRRGRQPQGAWQLKFQGLTEVHEIELHLIPRRGHGGGGHGRPGQALGGAQEVQNFKVDSDTFHARRGSVQGDQIIVQATRGKVRIHEVEVTFANGRSRVLRDMSGQINADQPRRSIMNGYLRNQRNVVSVKVRASSSEIRFPQAEIKVYVK